MGKTSNHRSEWRVSHQWTIFLLSPLLNHYPYQAEVEQSNYSEWNQELTGLTRQGRDSLKSNFPNLLTYATDGK